MMLLVNFDIAPSLEDDLIDCLLGFETLLSFSSFEIRRHGGDSRAIAESSTVERVTGRARALRFEVVVAPEQLEALLSWVRQEVANGVSYTVSQLHSSSSSLAAHGAS